MMLHLAVFRHVSLKNKNVFLRNQDTIGTKKFSIAIVSLIYTYIQISLIIFKTYFIAVFLHIGSNQGWCIAFKSFFVVFFSVETSLCLFFFFKFKPAPV